MKYKEKINNCQSDEFIPRFFFFIEVVIYLFIYSFVVNGL
jgi:hypothetical protein